MRVASPSGQPGFFARRLFQSLSPLTGDCIRLVDGCLERTFGDVRGELRATVVVHHPRFYRRVLLGGGLAAAEAWIDGDWSCDDLTTLVRIFVRHRELIERMNSPRTWLSRMLASLKHLLRRNTRPGARRNIHEHYDLGNEFFELFLDDTLSYSCAVFELPEATLEEASRAKLERLCTKLQLVPADHLVEIGTGWGGLALHAAGNYGCRVTTTTISRQQHQLATQRVREAQLAGRVQVLNRDYRDLEGRFDKLVSVEMIEAVGHEFFDEFFRRGSRLLKPDGMMLLQAIVIKDQFFAAHRHSVDFIRQHIFPGGCLPSVSALCDSMKRASDLRLVHLEEMSDHYAQTLRRWRQRFWTRIDAVRSLGYSERFIRKWDYYLRYCEAAFEERQVNVVQMLLAKPRCRLDPLTLALPPVTERRARQGDRNEPQPSPCDRQRVSHMGASACQSP
jgi:cyclopropane-fatty-acyl-phospholipid synthase